MPICFIEPFVDSEVDTKLPTFLANLPRSISYPFTLAFFLKQCSSNSQTNVIQTGNLGTSVLFKAASCCGCTALMTVSIRIASEFLTAWLLLLCCVTERFEMNQGLAIVAGICW
jgi:hypothetical protein